MADFLSRLVGRLDGSAPLARPVARPLFDPAPSEPDSTIGSAPLALQPSAAPRDHDSRGIAPRPTGDAIRADPRVVSDPGVSDPTLPTPRTERAVLPLTVESAPPRALHAAAGPTREEAMESDRSPASPDLRPEASPLRGARVAATRSASKAPREAPTIHVTIGRIEVRAVSPMPPTAPPPAARPRRPAIDLQAYLRSGGAGR